MSTNSYKSQLNHLGLLRLSRRNQTLDHLDPLLGHQSEHPHGPPLGRPATTASGASMLRSINDTASPGADRSKLRPRDETVGWDGWSNEPLFQVYSV